MKALHLSVLVLQYTQSTLLHTVSFAVYVSHVVYLCDVFSFKQRLCDYVCDLLLEESNVQPVSTPVTVCGDIHGQVSND